MLAKMESDLTLDRNMFYKDVKWENFHLHLGQITYHYANETNNLPNQLVLTLALKGLIIIILQILKHKNLFLYACFHINAANQTYINKRVVLSLINNLAS